ncbi:relaxase/mobilization nuclease domain-containing protein [Gluconobacter cerinus]|uniref:relaxase/mobilization nuclease domain-containing protein n=1 Tax=Gluconobacter cerinus TaxID=38307 RepID=UPI001B8C798D|nr:hypothetical protein [Gluconobacter cerinus]MBS1035564.1 hypothetical protein [Gluconobacter cerinus]
MSIIIKSTRIKTKSGPGNIVRHLLDKPEENEDIQIIQGDREGMIEAFDTARAKTKTPNYALRHWILSSTELMTMEKVMQSVSKLAAEFGFNPDDATIVMHQKARDGEDISNQHYHIAVPEVLENGRVMTNQKNYAKHEKICRELECQFGFSHIVGKHNKAVQYATKDLNPEVSEVAKELAKAPLPNARFSAKKYQEAKRSDIEIKELTRLAKTQCTDINSFEAIKARLDSLGLHIQEGTHKRKNGSFTPVIATQDGFVLGSVGGILKRTAQEVSDISDAMQKDREGMREKADLKAVEASELVGSTGTQTIPETKPETPQDKDHGGMHDDMGMTWEKYLEQEQARLSAIFDAPHPELVEESALDKKERVQLALKNENKEMDGLLKKQKLLKTEIQDLKDSSNIFNGNKKKAGQLEDKEMKEMMEKIARLAVYMSQQILYGLGIIKEKPDKNFILTELERKEIMRYGKESDLAKTQSQIQSKRDEGIYNISKRVAEQQSYEIAEWREREDAQDALTAFRKLNLLNNAIEGGRIDEQGQKEIMENIGNDDLNGVLNAFSKNNMRKMQREKAADLEAMEEPEKQEIQEEPEIQKKKKSQSFDM